MSIQNSKLRAGLYFTIRLLILALVILIFYNSADCLLPKYIQEDQFSFIEELSLFLKLIFCFCLFYGVFIFWEFKAFRTKGHYNLKNMAIIVLIINVLVFLMSLFLLLNYN